MNGEVKHGCAHTPVQQLESLCQAGRCCWGVTGWWPRLPRATMGAELLLPLTLSALMDQPQSGNSWLSMTRQPSSHLNFFSSRCYHFMLMFSLQSPRSPSNGVSAVLLLSVIFYFSYPCTDGLTALTQQSESRLHSWSVSKLDPLLEQLKPQQWGTTERG